LDYVRNAGAGHGGETSRPKVLFLLWVKRASIVSDRLFRQATRFGVSPSLVNFKIVPVT
jgi:hypothetical protein